MRQKDIEIRLTQLQDEDPTNPEIYELIVQLTGNMLKSQGWILSPIDFDNVTHDVAADMFMKVSSGYYIRTWKAFAYRLIKFCYVKKQRDLANPQIFDTNFDPTRREAIYRTCTSYLDSFERDREIVENKQFFSDIQSIIKDVILNSKFNENNSNFLALYTSVILTLLRNEDTYFHVSDGLKPYVHIFAQQVKKSIADSGIFTVSSDADIFINPLYKNALLPDLSYLEN